MRLLSVFAVLVFSSSVYAQKIDRAEITKAVKDLKPVVVKNQGADGIWFSTGDAEKLLNLVEKKLPLALDIIDAQDQQITSLNTAINLYKLTIQSYNEYANYNKDMLNTALKYFPELRPPEPPFYKQPVVVYIGGVLTGAAIIVVSAYVLDKTHVK